MTRARLQMYQRPAVPLGGRFNTATATHFLDDTHSERVTTKNIGGQGGINSPRHCFTCNMCVQHNPYQCNSPTSVLHHRPSHNSDLAADACRFAVQLGG
jgi:hypothetical protein